jgi:Major Facilitator Superfamily.
MNQLKKTLKQHQLIRSLVELKGNPKALLLMEPLWGIPFGLIAPFATLYMQARGITDIEIGLILSVATAIQVIAGSLGGVITDKFGRKTTTMFGDFTGWVIACLIWAFSGNFWLFLIAAAFNSMEQVNQTAWVCFVNEDTDPDQLVNLWNWVLIAGNVSVFFAPIAGVLIEKTSLISVMQALYIVFAVFMLIKIFITYKVTMETSRGVIRKKETKNQSIWGMMREYEKLIPQTLRQKRVLFTLAIMILLQCTYIISTNFFSLYVTSILGVSDGMIAIFPIVRAAVMLIFFFAAPKILDRISLEVPIIFGAVLYIICHLVLLFCPPDNLPVLFIYIFIDAVAWAIVIPRKETLLVNNIDEKERARILSLLTTLTLFASIPCGYIAGWLSSINRQYPFFLNLAMYVAMVLVVTAGWLRTRRSVV